MNENKSRSALTALQQKFSAVPDVRLLSDEQKAWIVMKIQSLSEEAKLSETASRLQKIRNRLVHATEDISDVELQKMVSFVFLNIDEIEKLVGKQE
ncbi:MAG: hypothetical protein J6O39_04280 [Treponema sp.]|nr:hypothetical protein [Treponema sp.]